MEDTITFLRDIYTNTFLSPYVADGFIYAGFDFFSDAVRRIGSVNVVNTKVKKWLESVIEKYPQV